MMTAALAYSIPGIDDDPLDDAAPRPSRRKRQRSPHANHYGQAEALHRPYALAVMQAIITFAPVWSNRRLAELAGCDESTASRIGGLLSARGAVVKTTRKTRKGRMCVYAPAPDCPAPVRRQRSKPRQSAGDCTNANKRRGTSSTSPRSDSSFNESKPPRGRTREAAQQQQHKRGADTEIPAAPASASPPRPASESVMPPSSSAQAPPRPDTSVRPADLEILDKRRPEGRLLVRERMVAQHLRFLQACRSPAEIAKYTVLVTAWLYGLEADDGPGKAEFERVDQVMRLRGFEAAERRAWREEHPELAGKAWKPVRPAGLVNPASETPRERERRLWGDEMYRRAPSPAVEAGLWAKVSGGSDPRLAANGAWPVPPPGRSPGLRPATSGAWPVPRGGWRIS